MKFLTRLTLFLTILFAVAPVAQLLAAEGDPPIGTEYGSNLLKNGGFEDAIDDTNWSVYSPTETGTTVTQSVYVQSGGFAFHISEQDIPTLWGISGIQQRVEVTPNEMYTLKADIFVDALETVAASVYTPEHINALVTMSITFYDGEKGEDGKDIPKVRELIDLDYPNLGFTPTELSGVVPADTIYAIVEVCLKARDIGGGGTFYVDNVELFYTGAPLQLHHISKTDTTINLEWDAPLNMSGFSHYEVYKDGAPLAVTSQIPSYTVTDLTASTAYVFTVRAVRDSELASVGSNEWRVATDSVAGYTTILALGDSLTHGKEIIGGYRYPLKDTLAEDGLFVDFVGSQMTDPDVTRTDKEHEGYPGEKVGDIYTNYVEQQVLVYEPDIVLLLAGTNDMFDGAYDELAHEDIEAIVSKITEKLPNTHVIVSSIPRILSGGDLVTLDSRILLYNSEVKSIVERYSAAGEKVSFVDMYPVITEDYYLPQSIDLDVDRIHPTAAGYNKMAEVWHNAVQAVIAGGPGTIDDTPPSVPTLNIQPDTITPNSVKLNWTASTDNVAVDHYEIWMNDIKQINVAATETTFTINDLLPETDYTFKVRALDQIGNTSTSEPLTIRTSKIPAAPPGGGGGGGGGGGYPSPEDKLNYETTENGIKLVYVLNKQKAINELNSADEALAIDIDEDKPFDQLELELSSEVLTLANSKNKPIIISFKDFTIQLPSNFTPIKADDTVTFTLSISTLKLAEQLETQSLSARSAMYELEIMINDKVVSSFNEPIQLTLTPTEDGDNAKSGIFLYDPLTKVWSYVGGKLDANGNISAPLPHFSLYAILESNRSFVDINDHWARLDIESLAAKQIVSGMTADIFNPSGEVTRAQFASMIARALQLKAEEGELHFADVANDAWYYSDVKAAFQAGIISGVTEDQFAPNAKITREQMAVMIVNAHLHMKDAKLEELVSTTALTYDDIDQISTWAQSYVEAAVALELIYGFDGGFKPDLFADRAQSAAIINRLLKLNV